MSTRKESGHIPAKKNQNIFDYIQSRLDEKLLRYSMKNALESTPQTIEITFQHLDMKTHCLCHVFRHKKRYFIGGWRMPDKIFYFPLQERAAW